MGSLEQQIYNALLEYEGIGGAEGNPMTASICRGHAEVAAKIALELAREAFAEGNGVYNDLPDDELEKAFNQFLYNKHPLWG